MYTDFTEPQLKLKLLTNRYEFGVIQNCYGEGDLELYEGKLQLEATHWESAPVLSL